MAEEKMGFVLEAEVNLVMSPEARDKYLKEVEDQLKKLEQKRINAANTTGSIASIIGTSPGGSGISSGGVGQIAGMLGGGVVGATVGAAAKLIEAPFALMAQSARNNVEAMEALNGTLGITAVGFKNSALAMKQIPIIGEHLAAMKDAQRKELEINLGYVAKAFPGIADQMRQATEGLQAAKGMAHVGDARRVINANDTANQIQMALNERTRNSDDLQKLEKALDETVGTWKVVFATNAQEREFGKLWKLKQEIADEKSGLTPAEKAAKIAEAEKIYGGKLPGKAFAGGPASMSGILDYQRQLQLKAFSQGGDPNERTATATQSIEKMMQQWQSRQDMIGRGMTGDEIRRREIDAANNRNDERAPRGGR